MNEQPTYSRDEVFAALDMRTYYERELPSLRWTGKEGISRCIFHEDTNPSLSVNSETGLFFCFGCGTKGSVLDFHMTKYNMEFRDALSDLASWTGISGTNELREAATYDYTDASGKLIFQVVRYFPKTFRQRRPDGKGGWVYSLRDVPRCLYNLPAVVKSDIIFIVEGERDVETLRGIGLVATTNPGGAGKWKDQYSQVLSNKNVVLLPDNDEPGRNHAELVAKSLKGIARTVKIVTLTEIPEKGDVSDYLMSHTKEDLLSLVAKEQTRTEQRVREYCLGTTGWFSLTEMALWLNLTGEEKTEARNIIASMEKKDLITRTGQRHGTFRLVDNNPCVMDLDAPPRDDVGISLPLTLDTLVVLFPKNVVVVAGEKDSGKTTFAMNTAFMNRDIMPVTYFNSEMGVEELQARIRHFPQNLYPFDEWKKIRWIERASRFEDLVDPDGLNIIDFLEIGAEAFTVTEDIKRVFDKLRTGLLLIVMQKRSYKDFAVGGEGTLEKARLAVNLEHGTGGENVCRITVAKNWTGVISAPRGYMCEYKIWQGGEMKKVGEWYRPEKHQEKSKRKGFEGT
jgi:5S rRNA maturation endonuclease (ribonuclease M5)